MAEEIIVIGAGGFGRETLDVIAAINAANVVPRWHVVGVFDDAPAFRNKERLADRGVRLLGPVSEFAARYRTARYVIGVGSPSARARVATQLDVWRATPATLVHPSASVGTRVEMSEGTVICGGVQISTNVRLGRHVHVNPGAIIGHDSSLADFVSINPGAIVSGDVRIEAETLVGAGATVLQGLAVGAGAVIGASACVTKDVESRAVMVGVPARQMTREARESRVRE